MTRMSTFSHAELKTMMTYDPEMGSFTWLNSNPYNKQKGQVSKCFNGRGYQVVMIKGKIYLGHRLAWFYMTGTWPLEVDHKDRNPSNNKWDNLRECTVMEQNKANRKYTRRNKHINLPTGVRKLASGFMAQKWTGKVRTIIGIYPTAQEAHEAFIEHSKQLYGDFVHE